MELDRLDLKVLAHLELRGRSTWSDLAGQLGLSGPATADRVRRLEEAGVITGYRAVIQPAALGYDLTAFIAVTLERPEHRQPFLDCIQNRPEVQECHHMTGDDDYLMKVICRNTGDLEHLLSEVLKQLPGVVRTRTSIALSTIKTGGRIVAEGSL